MENPGNGWPEHRLYVRKELDRLSDAVEDLTKTIQKQHRDLAAKVTANSMLLAHIKAKMGVVGAVFGVVGGAIAVWILGAFG